MIAAHHEQIARAQLAPYCGVELIVQPRGLDTGPGLLLPIARVRARSRRPHRLPAVGSSCRLRRAVEYGWIVRGRRLDGAHRPVFAVRAFREKPSAELARRLHARGGLWNTFISTGPVAAYWAHARRHLPDHARALERYGARLGADDERAALAAAYQVMTPANFSRDLLAHADDLAVIPVLGSGWCDWGTLRRVFASLRGTPQLDALLARIAGSGGSAAQLAG